MHMCPHAPVQMETWGRKLLENNTALCPGWGYVSIAVTLVPKSPLRGKYFTEDSKIAEPNAYCHIEWSTFSVISFIILLISVNLKSQSCRYVLLYVH